jgi:CYTH domain-containing protein
MGIEVERKFLVRDLSVLEGSPGVVYRQGYLSRVPERTVRVRVAGRQAFLTVKADQTAPAGSNSSPRSRPAMPRNCWGCASHR